MPLLKRLILLSIFLFAASAYAQVNDSEAPGVEKGTPEKRNKAAKDDESSNEQKPPKIGNFSLPNSQQPAALFGFGGNIIDKDEVQFYFFADEFYGKERLTIDLIPSFLYGVTDNFSLFFNTPVTPQIYDKPHRNRGFEDFFIQAEWAFYNHTTNYYVDQATVVFNVTYPTGSFCRQPPTGFGAPSIFLGATYYHVYVDWLFFTSNGATFTTSDHGNRAGDQFLYQCGMGRTFANPPGWIYAWLIEADGQYNKKNRMCGRIDHNSGGNTIWITPSIWASNKNILAQFGFSFPVNQNLFGKQHKFEFGLNFNISWSFY